MEKPLEEDYTKKYYKDKLTVNESTLSKLKLASEGMNLLIGDLYKYIDHLEAELKNAKRYLLEISSKEDNLYAEIALLKSNLYNEKQLESKKMEWYGKLENELSYAVHTVNDKDMVAWVVDYHEEIFNKLKTYKEEQEQ